MWNNKEETKADKVSRYLDIPVVHINVYLLHFYSTRAHFYVALFLEHIFLNVSRCVIFLCFASSAAGQLIFAQICFSKPGMAFVSEAWLGYTICFVTS